jgi:hypothetical protein
MDLIDFEKRGEYVLADVKSATWFFECKKSVESKILFILIFNNSSFKSSNSRER